MTTPPGAVRRKLTAAHRTGDSASFIEPMNAVQRARAAARPGDPASGAVSREPLASGEDVDRARALLASVDLNLLVVLDVLLADPTPKNAARTLGRTSSAISHALDRLRRIFDDPLFVRVDRHMVPTPRALAMRDQVAALSRSAAELFAPPVRFEPASCTRRFVLCASDYLQALVVPKLIAALRRDAPGVTLAVVGPRTRVAERLARGEIDVAIVVRRGNDAGILGQKLLADHFVSLVSAGCPRWPIDFDAYVALPHALVAPLGEVGGFVDEALTKRGASRRVAVLLPDFLLAPHALRGTDMILTLPARLLPLFDMGELRSFEPPLELPALSISMLWPERLARDPPSAWFRAAIATAVRP